MRRAQLRLALPLAALTCCPLGGCKKKNNEPAQVQEQAPPQKANPSYPACDAERTHTGLPPNVRPEMLTAKFWIARLDKNQATQRLLDQGQIKTLNQHTQSLELGVRTLPEALTPDAVKKQSVAFHQEQQDYVHSKLKDKSYVESVPGATQKADQRLTELIPRNDYFAFARNTQLRCWPIEGGIFKPPIDQDFDRNNCSTLQPPSVVHRIVSTKQGDWHYVQGEFVEGWAHRPSWQPVSAKVLSKRSRGTKRWVIKDHTTLRTKGSLSPTVSMGTVLSLDKGGTLAWPTDRGWKTLKLRRQPEVSRTPLTLRRDALLELVFSQLGRPYGWGGRAAERDCSRLLLDVFRVFGIQLPRFSGHQAQAANSVDVSMLSPRDKRATIRRFSEANLLILFMPGHVMLYLGADQDRDYAISSISEFVTPCAQADQTLSEQVHRLDRVTVTDLRLGENSPRRSFLERITRIIRI